MTDVTAGRGTGMNARDRLAEAIERRKSYGSFKQDDEDIAALIADYDTQAERIEALGKDHDRACMKWGLCESRALTAEADLAALRDAATYLERVYAYAIDDEENHPMSLGQSRAWAGLRAALAAPAAGLPNGEGMCNKPYLSLTRRAENPSMPLTCTKRRGHDGPHNSAGAIGEGTT